MEKKSITQDPEAIGIIEKYWRKLRNAIWEARLNIKTWGDGRADEPDAVGYSATSYAAIWTILNTLDLQETDVFVDIGCGKGRVTCCAARFQLERVIGIEVDAALRQIAERNAGRLRRRNSPISIIGIPAQAADYSDGTVFYLFNPFGAATLKRVLEQIHSSLSERPRNVRIVYVRPLHEELLRDCGWLRQTDSWPPCRRLLLRYFVSFWETVNQP